jgi:hypothetical protein
VQREPQTKNTRDPKFASPLPVPTMYGVMTAMIQFQSQLEAVERATPRERMGSGKISPITTQAAGGREVSSCSQGIGE